MSQYISPGIYTVERDLSSYVTDLSATIVGIVGTADKGPTNTPTLVTSAKEFVDIFGQVNPKHYLGYAAIAYLKRGNKLWVNRVAPADAAKAVATIPVPENYKQIAGEWVLDSQTATELTFTLTDFSALATSSPDKVVKLGTNTFIPKFDFTDATQANTNYANGKLGSDLATFLPKPEYVKGNAFNITLGPGSGNTATITNLVGSTDPKVVVPIASFPTANSPATAFAFSSIALSSTAFTAPGAVIQQIALDTAGTNLLSVNYASAVDDAERNTLVSDLSSLTVATKLTALESLLDAAGKVISWKAYDSSIAGNNTKSLNMLKLILEGLLYAVNNPSGLASYPNLTAFNTKFSALISTGVYGVGSIVTGASRGFKSVTAVTDALGNIQELRLNALVAGALGTFSYGTVLSPQLIVTNQKISGQFSTSMYRPSYKMVSAGASFVPVYLKFTSLGETDASNTAITLSFDPANDTVTGEQIYSVKIYERLTDVTISNTSTKYADFSLVEQFDGTLEVIQSQIATNSKRVALKIDYTTTDSVNMTTGVVTSGVTPEGLVVDFVLADADLGKGVASGTTFQSGTYGFEKIFVTFLQFGTIGTAISKNEIIGDSASQTGVYAFANPEAIDINLVVAPGWSADPAVARAMTSICESRGDAMAIIDTPFGLTVQNVAAYRKNVLNLNTSYGALYYPWVKITDTVNKKDIYVPPSGQVVGQYALNDQVADVYYAPAGINRGTLVDAIGTERMLDLGSRDTLALNQINPIHFEANYGIYIKGQQTLQTTTTALDRVNVRRLLLNLRKVIATASKSFEFEPNDSTTAYRLKQVAETFLEDRLRKGALQSYVVDVGPNVNTTLSRENNELRMEVYLVPTKAAEKIIEIYNILPQGGGVTVQ